MDLKAPAIYRMIKIRTCFLPRDLNDFDVVRNTLASLTQLNYLVQNEITKAKKSQSKMSNCLTWTKETVINYKDPDLK